MHTSNVRSLTWLLSACCSTFLLASCAPHAASNTENNQPGNIVSSPVVVNTALTSCPPVGRARNAVMPPLTPGKRPTIIYLVNEGPSTAPLFGKLERYDVTTGHTTEFMKLPNASIQTAMVSADGQWILFSAYVNGRAQLRMVRIDGQYPQTLYCAQVIGANISDGISSVQWSPNQRLLAFEEGGQGISTVYLLNTAKGLLSTALRIPNPETSYVPVAWLDDRHLYLMDVPSMDAPSGLYLLDTSRNGLQTPNDLQQVFKLPHGATSPGDQAQSCWDFDLSPDRTKLFISQCNGKSTASSDVIMQPATGGSQTVIFSSPTLHVDEVRAISDTKLFLVFANLGGNTGHNGLWKIRTDGTGLTQLTSDGTFEKSFFNTGSRLMWSNISRDGSMYTIQTNEVGDPFTFTLRFAPVQGGIPRTFVTSSAQTFIVGWTTI